jgi:hypothetical protein
MIVCVPAIASEIVAHRVVRVEPDHLLKRGDAQAHTERLPRAAVAYCVVRVEHRYLSYRTDDPRGRAFAHIALSGGAPLRVASVLARGARWTLHAARRLVR